MCFAPNGVVPISCHWEVAHVFCFCYFHYKVTNNILLCGLWLSERAKQQKASHISSGMVMCLGEKIAERIYCFNFSDCLMKNTLYWPQLSNFHVKMVSLKLRFLAIDTDLVSKNTQSNYGF